MRRKRLQRPDLLTGAPVSNHAGMMDMMKGNMTMMVPNMVMMAWINYFFSGFVLVKIPFGLTEGFKGMLQRGVDLKTLDPSYARPAIHCRTPTFNVAMKQFRESQMFINYPLFCFMEIYLGNVQEN